MVHYEKRDKIKIGKEEYTVLRVLRPRAGWDNYLVSDGKKQYLMNVFPVDEKKELCESIIDKKLSNYHKLKDIGIPMTEIVASDKNAGIIIREYKEGTPASLLILRSELSADYLNQVRDMAMLAEKNGYVLDYFPAEYICDMDKCHYVKYELETYQDEKSFDNMVRKFWMSVSEVKEG